MFLPLLLVTKYFNFVLPSRNAKDYTVGHQRVQIRWTIKKKGKAQAQSKDATVKDEHKEHAHSIQNYEK